MRRVPFFEPDEWEAEHYWNFFLVSYLGGERLDPRTTPARLYQAMQLLALVYHNRSTL